MMCSRYAKKYEQTSHKIHDVHVHNSIVRNQTGYSKRKMLRGT